MGWLWSRVGPTLYWTSGMRVDRVQRTLARLRLAIGCAGSQGHHMTLTYFWRSPKVIEARITVPIAAILNLWRHFPGGRNIHIYSIFSGSGYTERLVEILSDVRVCRKSQMAATGCTFCMECCTQKIQVTSDSWMSYKNTATFASFIWLEIACIIISLINNNNNNTVYWLRQLKAGLTN